MKWDGMAKEKALPGTKGGGVKGDRIKERGLWEVRWTTPHRIHGLVAMV